MTRSRFTPMRARLFAVCGLAAGLLVSSRTTAQTTNIIFEAAVNPQSEADWHSSVTVEPGATVYVRMRVQLAGATALGLAGITSQPTLSSWHSERGDSVVPFTFPGLNNSCPPEPTTESAYVGRHVAREPQTNTGRMYPFGFAGITGLGTVVAHEDPGNILRFAGSKAITATQNPAWGVTSAQLSGQLNGSCFDSSLNTVVFRYAVTIGTGDVGARTMLAGNWGASQNRATWFLNAAGTQTLNSELGETINATIIVTPGPGAATTLLLGSLACMRRRRC